MTNQVTPALLSQIRKFGKFDVGGCYNCGGCTISCTLTNDFASFPRRIIQYSLLGLKKPLLNSLEPWLCYYCGDCSNTCPRQAEPAESLMTLRRFLASQYDWTGIASKVYRSKILKTIAISLTSIFVLLLFLYYHLEIVEFSLEDLTSTPMGIEHMFNIISYFTYIVFLFPIFILSSNALLMYWFTMHNDKKLKIPLILYFTELKTLLFNALTQIRIKDCSDKNEWIRHMVILSGFVIMSVITLFFLKWFQTDNIYPIYDPQRWLGYIATAGLIWGSMDILIGRIRKKRQIWKFSQFSDWTLPILLILTALSGIAIHIFRYLELSLYSHFAYLIHLMIVVPLLIIEIPFGKLSHVIYRPLAIYFIKIKEKSLKLKTSEK